MTIYAVEHRCEDHYYNGYTECVFSTKEKAQHYIDSHIKSYLIDDLSIEEYEVDSILEYQVKK